MENTTARKPRKARLYAFFLKVDGKWVRQSATALPKEAAIRYFQTAMLNYSMDGQHPELRVVKS